MPDPELSQFTTVFRASEPRRVRRGRQPLSCTSCQKRKSRCDRRLPCGACEKRGDVASCKFGPPGAVESARGRRQEMQSRLAKLEEMVKGLADESARLKSGSSQNEPLSGNQASAVPLANTDFIQSGDSSGSSSESRFLGPTNWEALVESIHDIKSILEAEQDGWDEDRQNEDEAPQLEDNDIIFGDVEPVTIAEVLDMLPSRQDTDRAIGAYFNAKFIAVPFIHTNHFRRTYNAFWDKPTSANLLWISILLCIVSVGTMILRLKSTSPTSPEAIGRSRAYMSMAARCLVSGRYLKAKVYSVEAMLMYAHARNAQKVDADPIIWQLYGLAIRVAQRRGYHRDPIKASFKLSPYEAEMRRRVWFTLRSYDMLASYQQGMPNMVHEDGHDTDHPMNLTDDDFDEDSVVLNPRPVIDPFPITFYVQKSKLLPMLRRVMSHALGIKPLTFLQAQGIAGELGEWHTTMPPCLRYRSFRETSFTDPNYTIMHRIMLELLYRINMCNLFRPFIVDPSPSAKATTGKRAIELCRDAALGMLQIHIELDREIQPGGRFFEERYMVSSLSLHDFLVASMTLCIELTQFTHLSAEERADRIAILWTSYRMWLARSKDSADALHGSKVLRAILSRIDTTTTTSPSSGPASSSTARTLQSDNDDTARTTQSSQELASELGISEANFTNMLNFDDLPSLETVFMNNNETTYWGSMDRYLRQDTSVEVCLDLPYLDLGIGKSGGV
ncbi:unnamed protein product [Clonostachys rhizophaga]|uniref:Zn(2)-C6 fungal-type domain-containing protein n=1 Tax=Clonostachys rhizophaga TaxID=160324 RepID=A0A9N9V590_9HYPO|nr:unnamed protein product [Clonostachys rhizophaga]